MGKLKADGEGTSYNIISLGSFNPWPIPGISDNLVNLDRSTAIKSNTDVSNDYSDHCIQFVEYMDTCECALIDDETMVSRTLKSGQENNITDWGTKQTLPDFKKATMISRTLKSVQENHKTVRGTIQTLSDLKKANIYAVPSRLQCMRTNKAAKRTIHVVTGQEFIDRIGQPEYFSKIQLGNYLGLSKGDNSRKEMGRLMDLVPKEEKTQMTAITSAWSLLTIDDVQYQISSLAELSETCLDSEKIAQNVYNKMTGEGTEKEAAVDHTKQVMKLVMNEIKNTKINTVMHGEVMQAFWDVFERLLPKASK